MSSVQEIEQAIRGLEPKDLAELREWFATFDAEIWDRQMEQDVAAGRLDWLAAEITGLPTEIPWTLRIHDVGDYSEFRTIPSRTTVIAENPLASDSQVQPRRTHSA